METQTKTAGKTAQVSSTCKKTEESKEVKINNKIREIKSCLNSLWLMMPNRSIAQSKIQAIEEELKTLEAN